MRIKIRPDAAHAYMRRTYKHAHPECGMLHRPEWVEMLRKVQNTWLTVETEHLFKDQFNTAPMPGISELGMRIMEEDVIEIEDDARIGVVKCNYCGQYDHNKDNVCDKCGRTEYLELLK